MEVAPPKIVPNDHTNVTYLADHAEKKPKAMQAYAHQARTQDMWARMSRVPQAFVNARYFGGRTPEENMLNDSSTKKGA